jgi:hypothetical protein
MSIYSSKFVNRRGEDVAEQPRMATLSNGRIEQTGTPLVDKDGNYNADSRKDLINVIKTLTAQIDSGDVVRTASVDDAQVAKLVTAALNQRDVENPNGAFARVGQVVTDMISETMGRQMFTDKILARKDAKEGIGVIPPVEIDQMDVTAWHLTANGNVAESLVNPRYVPAEGFWITGLIYVEEQDLFFAGNNFLERKHQRGLEAIGVREDNVTKFLLDQAAPVDNDLLTFGAFTPTAFAAMRDQVWGWGLNPTTLLIAVDLWRDLTADNDWQGLNGVYSPVEKHVMFMEGKLGEVFGVEVFTDGYRLDTLKVLERGEAYMLGAPATLGVKIPLIPLNSEPVNQHLNGIPKRGWWLSQYESIVLANSKAVAKGTKL